MGLDLHISLSTILPLFLLVLMLISILWRSKTTNSNSKLPPGPKKLPLIGNIHNLGTLAHRSLAELAHQYGPIMHMQLGELSCIVISSPEMAKEVMNTHDLIFANRPRVLAADVITYGSKGMTFSPYGTYWRQMRKICTMELFAPNRVDSFKSIREEELKNIVKEISLSEGSSINLSEKIESLAYGLTSRMTFGKRSKDQQAYIEFMKGASEIAGGFSVADLYPSIGLLQVLSGIRSRIEKIHQGMDRILESVVRDHRDKNLDTEDVVGGKNQEDLVDVLLRLQKNDDLQHPLSDSVVKATIMEVAKIRDGLILNSGSVVSCIDRMRTWHEGEKSLTRYAYLDMMEGGTKFHAHKIVWKSTNPPKMAFILWLAAFEKLQTLDRAPFIPMGQGCGLCGVAPESHPHLFFSCRVAEQVWNDVRGWIPNRFGTTSLSNTLDKLARGRMDSGCIGKLRCLALAVTVYTIWNARNKSIFEGTPVVAQDIAFAAKSTIFRYAHLQMLV